MSQARLHEEGVGKRHRRLRRSKPEKGSEENWWSHMNVATGDSPTNMPLADSPHRGHQGAPANGGGRCWVAGRGHAPPEGGCGRWPAGALPRWLPFLVKQVLKQATTCFRTALNCEGMRRQSLLSGERKDPPIYYGGLEERSVSRSRGVSGL